MNLVAVTSCPTGIAHSQMAAESLEETAKRLNHDIHVEIQGAMGAENELSHGTIADADAAIIAADTSVSRDRFEAAGVPVVKGTVKAAINDTESLFERARETAGAYETGDADRTDADTSSEDGETDARADTGAQGSIDDVDTEQIGGDPRKGLFARLRRRLS